MPFLEKWESGRASNQVNESDHIVGNGGFKNRKESAIKNVCNQQYILRHCIIVVFLFQQLKLQYLLIGITVPEWYSTMFEDTNQAVQWFECIPGTHTRQKHVWDMTPPKKGKVLLTSHSTLHYTLGKHSKTWCVEICLWHLLSTILNCSRIHSDLRSQVTGGVTCEHVKVRWPKTSTNAKLPSLQCGKLP